MCPTYSSITTVRGSGPQYRSMTLEVHTPTNVVTAISAIVAHSNATGDSDRYSRYHMTRPVKPAYVPGAPGMNPVPSPVEIIT